MYCPYISDNSISGEERSGRCSDGDNNDGGSGTVGSFAGNGRAMEGDGFSDERGGSDDSQVQNYWA